MRCECNLNLPSLLVECFVHERNNIDIKCMNMNGVRAIRLRCEITVLMFFLKKKEYY